MTLIKEALHTESSKPLLKEIKNILRSWFVKITILPNATYGFNVILIGNFNGPE